MLCSIFLKVRRGQFCSSSRLTCFPKAPSPWPRDFRKSFANTITFESTRTPFLPRGDIVDKIRNSSSWCHRRKHCKLLGDGWCTVSIFKKDATVGEKSHYIWIPIGEFHLRVASALLTSSNVQRHWMTREAPRSAKSCWNLYRAMMNGGRHCSARISVEFCSRLI